MKFEHVSLPGRDWLLQCKGADFSTGRTCGFRRRDIRTESDLVFISRQLFNNDGRSRLVSGKLLRIDYDDPAHRGKPKPAIASFPSCGLFSAVGLRTFETVSSPDGEGMDN